MSKPTPRRLCRISANNKFIRLAQSDYHIHSSDGRVVRASAPRDVVSCFDSESGQTNDLKLVLTASLLDAQHQRDSVENKPASLLVVPLAKEFPYLGLVDRWPVTPKRAR